VIAEAAQPTSYRLQGPTLSRRLGLSRFTEHRNLCRLRNMTCVSNASS
jgi:hypothetical protein